MEKISRIVCILAMAAAMAACQREEPMAQTSEESTGVTVTVGAGFDDGLTKSEVETSAGVRTLKFTAGDRL